jgi:hypothetical protein
VFTRFLDDGRIYLLNNAAERVVRGIALGRKSWLFCGSTEVVPAPAQRLEVFTGAGRRRSWTLGEKASIVASSRQHVSPYALAP